MDWNKRRHDGKPTESILEEKALYPEKWPKRRLSKKTIQRRRERRRVEKMNVKVESTRQKLLMEQFAWKEEAPD